MNEKAAVCRKALIAPKNVSTKKEKAGVCEQKWHRAE
jgi:hypothetical protein